MSDNLSDVEIVLSNFSYFDQKHLNRPLLPFVVHGDEGDVGRENRGGVGILFVGDLYLVGDRGVALFRLRAADAENGAVAHSVAELDLVHPDGDELAMREVQ